MNLRTPTNFRHCLRPRELPRVILVPLQEPTMHLLERYLSVMVPRWPAESSYLFTSNITGSPMWDSTVVGEPNDASGS